MDKWVVLVVILPRSGILVKDLTHSFVLICVAL